MIRLKEEWMREKAEEKHCNVMIREEGLGYSDKWIDSKDQNKQISSQERWKQGSNNGWKRGIWIWKGWKKCLKEKRKYMKRNRSIKKINKN